MAIKEWLKSQLKVNFIIPHWEFALGPILMFGLGLGMNALVMAVNNNQMPVYMPGGCTLDIFKDEGGFIIHTCMTKASHLKFLADWFILNRSGIASPGDFFIWAAEKALEPGLFAWLILVLNDYQSKPTR